MIPFKDNMPVDRFPVVTVAIILANIAFYIAGGHGYGAVPAALTVKTAVTSMFVQRSVVQLIVNVWFLWLFGNNVEDAMGPVRFLAFYLVGGLASLGVQLAVAPNSASPLVGAAGAIGAVLGGYLVLYPRARIITLVLIPLFSGAAEVPVLVLAGLWIAVQAVFAAAGWVDPAGGAAAYLNYIGGLALGALTVRLVARRRKRTPPTAPLLRW